MSFASTTAHFRIESISVAVAAILVCLLLLAASPVPAAEDCDTCNRPSPALVFNADLLQQPTLTVPLFINGSFQQEIRLLTPQPGRDDWVDGLSLLEVLRPGVRAKLVFALQDKLDSRGLLNLGDLNATGIEARFDSASLQLQLTVPTPLMQTQQIRFRSGEAPVESAKALRPASISSFINTRMAMESTSGSNARSTLFADLDGAVNVLGVALEWQGSYEENRKHNWLRDSLRLVYDIPERRWRTTAGDLYYPTVGFQGFVPMGGISFSKNYALQPYRLTQPTVQGEFTLERESAVEVMVNDQVVRTLRLAPGPYNLRDLPLAAGLNDVKFRIRDAAGREDVLSYNLTLDSRLLAKGEDEFSYAVGAASTRPDGIRHYDSERIGYSVFHRYGVDNALTFGLDLQGNSRQHLSGLTALWGTPLGMVDLNLARSELDNAPAADAMRLQFRRNELTGNRFRRRTWQMSMEYRERNFAALGQLPGNSRVNIGGRVTQMLPGNLSVGVGGYYVRGWDASSDASGLHLHLAKSLDRGMNIIMHLEHNSLATLASENSIYLSVMLPLFAPNQRASLSSDSADHSSRVSWNYYSQQSVGGVDANVVLTRNPGETGTAGDAVYTGTRGRVGIAFDNAGIDDRTTLRAESALVFADGRFGIGRPVANSFALLVPHPTLAGQRIGINPVGTAYEASIDGLGNGVLPNLSPYRLSHARIDAGELPQGYELGPQAMGMLPSYKSGTLIVIGTGATVFVTGIVKNGMGELVALHAAKIVSLDEPGFAPISTFTNREGRFFADGLRPGRYELRLAGLAPLRVDFVIQEGVAGRVDLGQVVAEEAETRKTP